MSNNWKPSSLLRSIIENIPHMIFVKEAKDLKFVCFNKAGEMLLGLSRKDLIGKSDYDLFPKEQAEFFTDKDREVLNSKMLNDIPEEPIDTPNGRRILHTKKIPLLDEAGVPQYLLGISEDVTDILSLREQLQHAHKMEAVGTLASGVAHEFNNIHQAILMAAGIIKTTPTADEIVRSCADEILKSVERAGTLTNRLSAFAKRAYFSQPKLVDLNALIKNEEKKMRSVLGDRIEVDLKLGSALSPIRIDPANMRQVLLNLSENSRDAMPDGGRITIETSNTELENNATLHCYNAHPGKYVLLKFTDTGIGMNDNVKRRLFEPFFTTKGRSRGTGLGLAAIYGIVTEQGGVICVESQLKKGTTFQIYLPQVINSKENRNPDEFKERVGTNPITILLVDDEEAVRTLMRHSLERLGYVILEASTPEQAIQTAHDKGSQIDLLLTDLVMPLMNGRDLAERLQSSYPDMRVLFMSGYSSAEEIKRDDFMKGKPFVAKPCNIELLDQKIREALA